MRIYFTRCNSLMSKVMRWTFDEPVSHVGLGFFEDTLRLAIDVNTHGCCIQYRDAWLRDNEALFALDLPLLVEAEHHFYHTLCRNIVDTEYDYAAYMFGFWQGLKRKAGLSYARHNTWANDQKLACVEIFVPLRAELQKRGIPIGGMDFDEYTPWMLYNEFKALTYDNGQRVFHDVPRGQIPRPRRLTYKRS